MCYGELADRDFYGNDNLYHIYISYGEVRDPAITFSFLFCYNLLAVMDINTILRFLNHYT